MPDTPKKFYLTTPIYYVNARPHIGHAYSTIAADVIARRHRLLGDDTFFLTGTDEHGQKVQRSAEAAGIPPQQFADEVSATFQNLWKRMGITNNDYIRTTDERHRRGVQKLWTLLAARGAIYLSTYTGQYSVGEEMFVEGPPGTIGPDGKPTETVTEENYFFRLSDYQEKLINLIESGELHIQPETTKNEVLSFLRGNVTAIVVEAYDKALADDAQKLPIDYVGPIDLGTGYPLDKAEADGRVKRAASGNPYVTGALKDLSISRTTFDWGIPVPSPEGVILSRAKNPRISPEAPQKSAENHVIYVWLDALANYITAVGYGSDDPADIAKFEKYWPADVHLVGKEITRFHCVYWPAFLMAAGLPLPKSVVANGWLLFEESKMSKSRGNVVRTETILDAFGPLCPPVPRAASVDEPTPEVVILSEAKNPRISPEAPHSSTEAKDGSSSGLQPAVSVPISERALAPGLAQPTKAQQDLFASDVIRYFLLREIPFGQDGSFSFDALITRYNADLANGYGNLVSRTLSMIEKYFGGLVPDLSLARVSPPNEGASKSTLTMKEGLFTPATGRFAVPDSFSTSLINSIQSSSADTDFTQQFAYMQYLIAGIDQFITATAPWKIAAKVASDPSRMPELELSIWGAAQAVRIITALLYPIMPYATASVWRQLGLGDIEEAARNGELKNLQWGGLKPGTKLGSLAPIFPRADQGPAQIMTEMESPAIPAPAPASDAKSSEPTAEALNAVSPGTDQNAAASAAPAVSPTISIDDFIKIDLRVAQIVVAERIPKADKLLRLEVDLGYERRQILAGIAEYYAPETLIGRKVVIVANLAPRKMRGLESQGMIVAASLGPAGAPVLAGFLEDVELGARLK